MMSIASVSSSAAATQNSESLTKSILRLASASRLADPSDDAAGVAVSANLTALTSRLSATSQNTQDVVSFASTADGFLSTVQSQLSRLGELSIRSLDGTLDSASRQDLSVEFNKITQQIGTITSSATFNGTPVFQNTAITTTVNANGATDSLSLKNTSPSTLGISGLDISTPASAATAFFALKDAFTQVTSQRGEINADVSKFNFYTSNIRTETINTEAANSRISDLDVAAESTNLASNKIRNQFSTALLAQANTSQKQVLALLT